MQENQKVENYYKIGREGFFLSFLFIGIFLFSISTILLRDERYRYEGMTTIAIIILIADLFLIISQILSLALLHHIWKFVINESRDMNLIPSISSPGKAVGFLFIPIFNIFWMFRVYGFFAKDYNALAKAKGSNQKMPVWLGIIVPLLIIIFPLSFYVFMIYNESISRPDIGFIIFFSILYLSFFLSFIFSVLFICVAVNNCKSLGKEFTYELDKPVKNYSNLFNYQQHRINYFLGAGLFLAVILTYLVSIIIDKGWIEFIKSAFSPYGDRNLVQFLFLIFSTFIRGLYFVVCFLLLSYSIKNNLLLIFLFGIIYALVGSIFRDIFFLFFSDFEIIKESLIIYFMIRFIFGILIMGSFVFVISFFGPRIIFILLATIIANLLNDVFFNIFIKLMKPEINQNWSNIIFSPISGIFWGIFFYLGVLFHFKSYGYKLSNGILKKIE
jgi:hypothetical protein